MANNLLNADKTEVFMVSPESIASSVAQGNESLCSHLLQNPNI